MKKMEGSNGVWIRLFLCIVILAAGFGGFVFLKKMKKPPVQTAPVERPMPVEAVQVRLQPFPVRVTGLGEIRSRTSVVLSAEVAGRVTAVHPGLEVGGIINEGEVLAVIDDRDFRLEKKTARDRLQTLRRDHELAVKEYERLKTLYEENRTGTLAAVEKAESGVNAIVDRMSQVRQALDSAKLRLERSVIRAPFTCRITEVMVEQFEYVTPGRKLMTIVDDGDLEIVVSLDSRDVVQWLAFAKQGEPLSANWFAPLVRAESEVAWTENDRVKAKGVIDRIVRFDSSTRTVQVAIRLEQVPDSPVSLVEGMFCRVSIPGRVLDDVVVLPRHAVSFDNTVYVAVDNRLRTRKVTVARLEQDKAVIAGGLAQGEIVITTRLEQPLENALLAVTMPETDRP